MNSIISLKDVKKCPFIIVSNGIIIELNQSFTNMTKFENEDLLGKTVKEAFTILRVGSDVSYKNIDDTTDYFLFTKSFEVKFVNIKVVNDIQESRYIFLEKPNSSIDVKFPVANALCLENYYGIGLYSMPDMTLLKANDKYISFFDEPFNKKKNCIGRHMSEFVTGFKGSSYEEIWNTVLKTGKSYNVEEYRYEGLNRGITYWKLSLIPVSKDNRIKYCFAMATEITEQVLHRKKIEEQARIIKNKNKCLKWQADLLNSSREAIFVWELDGSIIYWNKGAEQVYGYSKEEALGRTSHELLKTIHTDHFENIKLIMLNKGLWNGEIEHTRKDGTKLIVETCHQIIEGENGHKIVLEINHDITYRKKMEMELKEKKNELEEIIQSIDDAIFIYDGNKNCYLTNNSAKKYFPKTQLRKFGDIYNQYKYYDLNGNKISLQKSIVSKVFRDEVVTNEKIILKNNHINKFVSVNGRPIYDVEGNIKFAVFCSRDITKDVESRKIIEKQKKDLEIILDNMNEGFSVINKDGSYIKMNKICKQWAQSYHIDSLYATLEKFKYYDVNGKVLTYDELPGSRVLKGEKLNQYQMLIKYNGIEKYLSVSGIPIYDESGNLDKAVLNSRDITEQVKKDKTIEYHRKIALKAEMEKREALEKAIAMKDEFLSLISHEFRTPLNVISTAIQTLNLLCSSELSDRSKKYINIIRQNTFRQLRLVNNLLDITRADAGRIKIHKKNVDIVFMTNSIVESVYTYASQKGVAVIFESSIEKKIIAMDDEKYERILLNLLSNAIKFTSTGKLITVRLRSFNNNIRIQVKDNGIGIPEDKLGVIFERFGQVDSCLSRQAEGSGIGLSLVKRLVDSLGGSISVKSKEGKGSTFTILFPNEKVSEETDTSQKADLLDNRLVQVTTVEFSDIYL